MSMERLSGVARATIPAAKEIPTSAQSLAARARTTRDTAEASFDLKSDIAKST
jgi:hypothetical protein